MKNEFLEAFSHLGGRVKKYQSKQQSLSSQAKLGPERYQSLVLADGRVMMKKNPCLNLTALLNHSTRKFIYSTKSTTCHKTL